MFAFFRSGILTGTQYRSCVVVAKKLSEILSSDTLALESRGARSFRSRQHTIQAIT